MQFSSLLVPALTVAATAVAAAPDCPWPFEYDTTPFRPNIFQTFDRQNTLVSTQISNNTISIKRRTLSDGEIVRIQFLVQGDANFVFVPETVTFVSTSPETAQVAVYPVSTTKINVTEAPYLNVNVNADLINHSCQPLVDAGSFYTDIQYQAIA